MGRSKALLDAGGRTFLARILASFGDGGARPLLVIVTDPNGPEAEEARSRGAEVLENPDPTPGSISSLQIGIRGLPADAPAVFFCPVDHPLFRPDTVRALRSAFVRTHARVLSPVHGGYRGHPVLFHRALFPELLEEGLQDGARTVIARYLEDRRDVPVDDPGVLVDIDTPEDYRRHFP